MRECVRGSIGVLARLVCGRRSHPAMLPTCRLFGVLAAFVSLETAIAQDAPTTRAVAQHGERLAVDVPPGTDRAQRQCATYAELAAMAEAVAALLRANVTREALVLVLLPRATPWLYAAQIGVLQAGGAHVCVDPSFPDAHLQHVTRDAKVVAIVTDVAGASRIAPQDVPVVIVPRAPDPRPVRSSCFGAA